MRPPLATLLLTLLLSGGTLAQRVCPAPPPDPPTFTFSDPASDTLGLTGRTDIFDAAVKAALEKYVDPSFGGHDFQAIAAAARPGALAAATDAQFYQAMRDLFQGHDWLNISFESPAEQQAETANNASPASFGGIGMQANATADHLLRVYQVYPGTPAARAGLRSGETITAVDGRCPLIKDIRGRVGNVVELTVRGRDGKSREVVLTRATISSPPFTPTTARLPGDIGYLAVDHLYASSQDTELYQRSLQALQHARPLKGLILDLRPSQSGYAASEVPKFLSLFVPAGTKVFEIRDRAGAVVETEVTSDQAVLPTLRKLPLVVLADKFNALQEVTAVLQQQGRARVIGQVPAHPGTFNTGSTALPLGATLWIGVQESFLPDGQRVATAFKPDVSVPDGQAEWQAPQDDPLVAQAVRLIQQGR